MLDLPMLASLCCWYSMENTEVEVYTLPLFLHVLLSFLPHSSHDLVFSSPEPLVFIPSGP